MRDETARLLERSGVPLTPSADVLEVLVTTFRELRAGETSDGQAMERLTAVMSTAEAVSVAHAVGVRGYFLRGRGRHAGGPGGVPGRTAAKDSPEDLKRLRSLLRAAGGSRATDPTGSALYEARHLLPG